MFTHQADIVWSGITANTYTYNNITITLCKLSQYSKCLVYYSLFGSGTDHMSLLILFLLLKLRHFKSDLDEIGRTVLQVNKHRLTELDLI